MNGFFTLRDLILLQVRKDLAAGLSLKEHSPIVAQLTATTTKDTVIGHHTCHLESIVLNVKHRSGPTAPNRHGDGSNWMESHRIVM